ncbi:hypothetical protein HHK36_013420 [Tetracentron sinense]|uniref:START domain-containing protein n=1 Tax=Tetracentron sinense TaxID=13715 RepID=A0A834Z3B7_TETSI|nr:hypothetical protein HHK36_013420 [Tetracentron sinense]
MGKRWVSASWRKLGHDGSMEFLQENIHGGWATILALLFILIWKSLRRFRSIVALPDVKTTLSVNSISKIRISEIISDEDLRSLMDGELEDKEKWDHVIHKTNNLLTYNARCCKPKEGPLKYLSVTIFENCSTELLRDFYLDNEYRKQWDKTLVEHEQLQVDETNGTEIGRTIKKFPLLTPREYILAWRVWEGKENTFYCFIKECEHALVPRRKKYVRVGFFRSGWRIRKVPGRNACEIKMVHQEDAGLNVEMAKLAFSKGIWSYVCKMDSALRKYSPMTRPLPGSSTMAVTLIQKVPPEFDTIPGSSAATSSIDRQVIEVKEKKLSRSSKKWIANGLLLLGGVVYLTRGHSTLGAKIAVACILKKLTKHGTSSSQNGQSRVTHDSLHHN